MRKMVLSMICFMCFMYAHAMGMELKTVYQKDAPPKYINESDQMFGICVDIINALNSRLREHNIRIVSIDNVVPFARIKKHLEYGVIDVFFGITKNKEREKLYRYANHLYEMHYTFAKLKSNPFEYTGEASLQDKAVGALRGTNSAKAISKIQGVKVNIVSTIPKAFKMLMLKRIDMIYYHNLGLEWNIKHSEYKNDLKLVKNPHDSRHQYLAFSKNVSSNIVTQVEEVLSSMAEDGTFAKIMQKYR